MKVKETQLKKRMKKYNVKMLSVINSDIFILIIMIVMIVLLLIEISMIKIRKKTKRLTKNITIKIYVKNKLQINNTK